MCHFVCDSANVMSKFCVPITKWSLRKEAFTHVESIIEPSVMEIRVWLLAAPPGWYGMKGTVEYCHAITVTWFLTNIHVGLNRVPRNPRLSGRKNYEKKRQAA